VQSEAHVNPWPPTSPEARPAQAAGLDPTRGSAAFGGAIAESEAMRAVLATLQLLAPTDIAIMLVGEAGTGKTRLARAIHEQGRRADECCVVLEVPAAGSGGSSLETETYASAFARARGGTLVIDGVESLSLDAQALLLAVLRGASAASRDDRREYALQPRTLTTTQRELEAAVLDGRFLRDLYFRLAGAVVRIPALRERGADLALLVRALLDELGRPELSVSSATLECLRDQDRAGNVRELQSALSQAIALADGAVLEPQHVPGLHVLSDAERLMRLPLAGLPLSSLEHAAIVQTLALYRGNKVRAARVLRIAVSTLYEKLKRHGL
jgi:two-component system, NtrC family, response regulator